VGPEVLAQVLRPLTFQSVPPALLVGLSAADDAAVYQVNEQQAIISTADFFPPVVDDPYAFGAIAAANAMSDIYAMGGKVLMAINLVAWPADLDPSILSEILRGGADIVARAGAVIAGGHTVTDQEPKYGLAVTGMVHPQHILTKGGAQPGDYLVLSKPLGTGLITTPLVTRLLERGDALALDYTGKRGVFAIERARSLVASHACPISPGCALHAHSFRARSKKKSPNTGTDHRRL